MNDVYQLVGKESRSYIKDGVQKFYNGLHLVSMAGGFEGVDGSSVQTISCPRSVDPARLKIGEWYEIKYSHFRTAKGLVASVSDLVPYEGD